MKDFQFWIQKYQINCKRLASVNGPDPEEQYIKCTDNITHYKYRQGESGKNNKELDLYLLNLNQEKKFDFWIVQQTFEHIYNGHEVLRRIQINTVCDGYIFISVPIYNIPHSLPLHFYGYTPMGLVTMMFETGWRLVDIGMWGNREYLIELLKRRKWLTLFDALDAQEESNYTRDFFVNDPFYGFQVWALGLKNCSA